MADYQRLSSRWTPLSVGFGTSSLWTAEDHLLLVKSNGYSEEYLRFFFTDIKAVIVYQTRFGFWVNVFCLIWIGIFLLLGAIIDGGDLFWGFVAIAGVPFILLVVNWILGPTAKAVIETESNTDEILLSGRYRRSLRLLADINSRVQLQQGSFNRLELAEKILHPQTGEKKSGQENEPNRRFEEG